MSVWTHVVATFRYDGFDEEFIVDGTPDWDRMFGRCTTELDGRDEESIEAWYESLDHAFENEGEYAPLGSEGSLQRTVWENQNRGYAARYVVNVFGDLRDFSDTESIKKWFVRSCNLGILRQGVCHVSSDISEPQTWACDWVFSDRELEL